MKIELKNIQHAAFASEETECFSASLYVDGKKIGDVGNDGHGGPNYFRGDDAAYKKADEWCKANLPKWGFNEKKFETDLEMQISNLVTDYLDAKDLKKNLKKQVVFIESETSPIRAFAWRGVRAINEAHINEIAKEFPNATILNKLPFDEALKIYQAHSVG